MDPPYDKHKLEFVFKTKSTGKTTVQLIVDNVYTFVKRTTANTVNSKAHFKCSKVYLLIHNKCRIFNFPFVQYDSQNCKAYARAVLVKEGTADSNPEYVCENLSNEHNHEIDDEDIMVQRVRHSLREAVLAEPFSSNHKNIYYSWYTAFLLFCFNYT